MKISKEWTDKERLALITEYAKEDFMDIHVNRGFNLAKHYETIEIIYYIATKSSDWLEANKICITKAETL